MSKSKVERFLKGARRITRGKALKKSLIPQGYEIRRGQKGFIDEASNCIKNNEVFLGSAPCGIGKSLASLLAVLPQLEENKLMICFRTRSQLYIYLKELRALSQNISAISFFSKKDMCPLRMKRNLSYFDFFEMCKKLKDNCESSVKPYCRFYWNNVRAKNDAERLALDCAQRVLSPRETVTLMSKQGYCGYEALKKVLHRVNVFLGTYHYVFDPKIRATILKSFGADLSKVYLIVDEAHNLPAFARELLSDQLTRNTVERALRETERFEAELVTPVREYLRTLEEVFRDAQRALKSEKLKQVGPQEISDFFLTQSGVPGDEVAEVLEEYGEYVREKRLELGSERILSYNYRVGKFLDGFFERDRREHIHLVEKDQKGRIWLEFRSFDGRELTDPVLSRTRGSILMSGFLSPPEVYRDLTLYDQSSVCLKEFDSPFPPENRLILVARGVSSAFKERTDKMLDRWRDYIEAISEVNEGNIAVFFTSYRLMRTVLPSTNVDRKKIVEQHKTRRNNVIKQLAESSDNALFGVMGGKFSEGIDYPNNALTCVAAVGLPYATWDIYQRALIEYLEHQFPRNGRKYAYLTPAILRLIQTCGRVHRSAKDKGCIAILDGRVAQPSIRNQLPEYYQREMKIVTSPTKCKQSIDQFWLNLRD